MDAGSRPPHVASRVEFLSKVERENNGCTQSNPSIREPRPRLRSQMPHLKHRRQARAQAATVARLGRHCRSYSCRLKLLTYVLPRDLSLTSGGWGGRSLVEPF